MSWKHTWKSIFFPEFDSGGLSLTRDQVSLRVFENAEAPSTTGTLAAAWTGTNVTVTRETSAPLNGEGSVKVVVAGGTGSVYKAFNRAMFGFPFPGYEGIRIRYVKFRATCNTGSHSFRLTFGDASDANHYRYWNFTVAQSKYTEWIVDMDPDNTESYPAPTTGSSTWTPKDIDRFGFTNLESGVTYYFDDIEFLYEYSLEEILGFPTEAPVDMGDYGSINARINGLWANVKALESRTWQYVKSGMESAEVDQSLEWAITLLSDFAPPSTTEIEPGNYQIDRIRGGVTTNMVASTPASESAGTIYATYMPLEVDWDAGDLIKVTFSGGYVRTDEDPAEALTANATAGTDTVQVANAYEYQVGWLVRVYDSATPAGEYLTILALVDPTTIQFSTNLVGNYTTANTATITRAIRTDLDTAVFFTMLQSQAQNYKILERGTFTTSSAMVPADTVIGGSYGNDYFNGCWLLPVSGVCINQPRLIVDYAGTTGVFTLDEEQPFTAAPGLVEYVILGPNSQLTPATDGIYSSTPAHVIGDKTDTPDYTFDATASSLMRLLKGVLGVEVIEEGTFTTSSATVPADTTIGGLYPNDYFNGSWLMPVTGANAFQPRLICDFADTTGVFTLDTEQPFNVAPGLVAYVILSRNSQLAPAADSIATQTPAHVIGRKTDTPDWTHTATESSLVRLIKGILGSLVIGEGTLTTSSNTVPADTSQGAKVTGFYKGSWLMPLTGDCAFQPRLICDFTTATGVFSIDLDQPFTAATGLVTYVILSPNGQVVPAQNSGSNQTPAHVIGNKTETTVQKASDSASLSGYLKAAVSRGMVILQATVTTGASLTTVSATQLVGFTDSFFNDNFYMQVVKAGGAAPEHEVRKITAYTSATGTFVCDAFSANVEAGDEILIIHESLVAIGRNDADNTFDSSLVVSNDDGSILERLEWIQNMVVIAKGTFTTSSTTVPADTGRTEGADYFNGNILMPLTGSAALQPRLIVDFTNVTGVFTLDPDQPFTAAPGLVEYVVLSQKELMVPAQNGTNNYTIAAVVGNKTDSPDYTFDATTSSIVALLKGVLGVEVIEEGTLTTDSATVPADTVLGGAYGNDYFNGSWLMTVEGAAKFQPRLIVDFATTTGILTLDPEQPFTVAPGLSKYVILSRNSQLVPAANGTNNSTPAHVLGNKADAVKPTVSATSSALGYLKALVARGMAAIYGVVTTGGSDVTVASTDLVGFGDDFFKTHYYVQVLKSSLITIGTTKIVTGYTSTTGTFTFASFGANFTAGDLIVLLHESLVAIGRNDTDNEFDSSNVVANDDGSVLERAEYIQQQLGYGVKLLVEDTGGSTTLITASEITEAAGWWKNALILGITGHNIGVVRPVVSNTVGTITVFPALREANVAADTYLLISAYKPQVFEQQADTAVNLSLTQGAAATNVLSLATAGYSYEVNQLVLKSDDPTNGGATTQVVTISLYELINDVSTLIDTFTIDGTNFGTYFTLFDMFGQVKLTGDSLIVTAALSAGATTPIAVTGQYQHALVYTGAG